MVVARGKFGTSLPASMLLLNTSAETQAARNENGKLDHLGGGGGLSSSPSYQIDGLSPPPSLPITV